MLCFPESLDLQGEWDKTNKKIKFEQTGPKKGEITWTDGAVTFVIHTDMG